MSPDHPSELPSTPSPVPRSTSKPLTVGLAFGALSAILGAYLGPLVVLGVRELGVRSFSEYMAGGNWLCIPFTALWSLPLALVGALLGDRLASRKQLPVAPSFLVVLGSFAGGALGFLISIPFMVFVIAMAS